MSAELERRRAIRTRHSARRSASPPALARGESGTPAQARGRSRGLRLVVLVVVALLGWMLVAPAGADSQAPTGLDIDDELLCTFDTAVLPEVSGITYSRIHPGIIWATNDSYNGPFIYALDTSDCRIRATLRLDGVVGRDHEALAAGVDAKGRDVIWIGDIGDNGQGHPYARIHKILEPKELRDAEVPVTTYRFVYEGGPLNAEALLAAPDREQLWVASKEADGGRVFQLPSPLSDSWKPMVATKAGTTRSSVTDGAMSPDGSKYVLRDYYSADVFRGEPMGVELSRFRLPLGLFGESITWTPDGRSVLVASEGSGDLTRVAVPAVALGEDAGLAPLLPTVKGFSTYPYLRLAGVALASLAALVLLRRAWRRRRRV